MEGSFNEARTEARTFDDARMENYMTETAPEHR
jgi:hypothetical protein